MTDAIEAGSILVEGGTHLPNSLALQNESSANGWDAVKGVTSTVEKEIQSAGWTFFFMAGEMKAKVFGFDRQKTMRVALNRLIAGAKSQSCNSIEITRVSNHSFLKVPYVSVTAHARHVQKGQTFFRNGNLD